VHGISSSEDAQKDIEEIMPMLVQYLQTGTFGHFESRLSVLECFRMLTSQLAQSDGQYQAGYKRMATMLHNTVANAQLFSTRITESLQQQRNAIDKSIKDFVQLASWKDVNVYALKASAIKSHRHLHRSVRKFREVLQQPVSPILGDLNSVIPQDGAQNQSKPDQPALVQIDGLRVGDLAERKKMPIPLPVHLDRLEETFAKYTLILDQQAETAGSNFRAASALEDMSIDIIETTASLAKETPSTLTKDYKKAVANLASRKRKAYSDLLKALRASGFSASVRADMLAKQHSAAWMANREPLLEVEGVETKKIENYRHRLGVLMVSLRRAFNGHSDDIASGDLERGIGFTESLVATTLAERDE
jgi:midasin